MSVSEYLTYGGATEGSAVDVAGTLEYLTAHGFAGGYLEQARDAVRTHGMRESTFEALGANHCDFCFARLMGGEYDRLSDGRERCVRCSRHVLRTTQELEESFHAVNRNLEIAFGVSLRVPLTVRMVGAREIARRSQETFQATPGVDPRVLGFAQKTRAGYSLFIENGSPLLAAVATMAHELTHIWQFTNWDAQAIDQRYGAHRRLLVYEGMATWVQVQYLMFVREFETAARHAAYAAQRTDEYGIGFRTFVERYPLSRERTSDIESPFRNRFPL